MKDESNGQLESPNFQTMYNGVESPNKPHPRWTPLSVHALGQRTQTLSNSTSVQWMGSRIYTGNIRRCISFTWYKPMMLWPIAYKSRYFTSPLSSRRTYRNHQRLTRPSDTKECLSKLRMTVSLSWSNPTTGTLFRSNSIIAYSETVQKSTQCPQVPYYQPCK